MNNKYNFFWKNSPFYNKWKNRWIDTAIRIFTIISGILVFSGIIILPVNANKTEKIYSSKNVDTDSTYAIMEVTTGFSNYGWSYIEYYELGSLSSAHFTHNNEYNLSFENYLKLERSNYYMLKRETEKSINDQNVKLQDPNITSSEKLIINTMIENMNYILSETKKVINSLNSSDVSLKLGSTFIGLFTVFTITGAFYSFVIKRKELFSQEKP